jgi:hypothetical protein
MESMQGVLNDSASGRFKANKRIEGDSSWAVRTGGHDMYRLRIQRIDSHTLIVILRSRLCFLPPTLISRGHNTISHTLHCSLPTLRNSCIITMFYQLCKPPEAPDTAGQITSCRNCNTFLCCCDCSGFSKCCEGFLEVLCGCLKWGIRVWLRTIAVNAKGARSGVEY